MSDDARMTNRPPAIEIAGLCKSFGDHRVLDGLDLTVAEGTVHALLGPNGAGKTTAVNICSTLLEADAGDVRVAGHDVRRNADDVRRAIGVTGQFSAIDLLLTGRENLRLMADLAHLPASTSGSTVDAMLERLDLVDAADRRAQTYSGGMQRRLDLAMTLLSRPRVIFLDEPTTGLDPRSRRELWSIVREQVAEGVTVLLTTQYLDEADALADRVSLLDSGRLVADGSPVELKRQVPGGHVEVQVTDRAALERISATRPDATVDHATLTIRVPNDGVATIRRLLDELDDSSLAGLSVQVAELDDVFLALTGRPAQRMNEPEHELEAAR
jgi:ABC-2 type transport system ATP-binding protein